MEKENIILEKSKDFAVRIIHLSNYLKDDKREYVLSTQILRSGTSIGANIHESKQAQSNADFISKLSIALKEATETEYWLELLVRTNYLSDSQYESIDNDCKEICKLLTSIIKTSKMKSNKKQD